MSYYGDGQEPKQAWAGELLQKLATIAGTSVLLEVTAQVLADTLPEMSSMSSYAFRMVEMARA